jgi:hypothetical protein
MTHRHDHIMENFRSTNDVERRVARVILEAGVQAPPHPNSTVLPGDPWALRGIPAVGVRGGVGGAIPGTLPHSIR